MWLRTFLLLLVLAAQPVVGFAAVWLPAGDMATQAQQALQDHCTDEAMDSDHEHPADSEECQLECQTCGSCAGAFIVSSAARTDLLPPAQSRNFMDASPAGPPHEQLYRPPISS